MTLKSLSERKKELIHQVSKNNISNKETYLDGMKIGIIDSFNSFSDLITQYLKYQNNVNLLMSYEKNIWQKWVNFYEKQSKISKADYIKVYNTWLFDFLFSNTFSHEEMFNSLY
jgi:predicted CopG family antitoxin